MTSSARENTRSQGTPREGARTLHRSLSLLLFHPCWCTQICKNGGSVLYTASFTACCFVMRRSQSRDRLSRQETAAGEMCVGFFFPCVPACVSTHALLLLQGPWLTHAHTHTGTQAHTVLLVASSFNPLPWLLSSCFCLLWFQLLVLSNHTCRQL